ncbi:hypothetical protein [Mycobacterium sp. 1274756.6]|uniref:hypothetical protein n=1 Tax=Mycobacterium sp. 1274756.6 TaxID=1834076 RepID=UPI001E4565FE|nr:hypothetical protein [Mycobacterium sp. 1274756.6]
MAIKSHVGTVREKRPAGPDEMLNDDEGACPADSTGAVGEATLSDGDSRPGEAGHEHGGTRRRNWRRLVTFNLIPALVMLLAVAVGILKWWDSSLAASRVARVESVEAATDATIAMLSYQPGTVEEDLTSAARLMTGDFEKSYADLTREVVIPGARDKRISAVASVPAAASLSATPSHAVVLVFVNQTAVIGDEPPTDTASTVRVTLDKVDGQWLVSDFTPI